MEEPEPFYCSQCSMKFSSPKVLKEHMLGHGMDIVFQCEKCDLCFANLEDCDKHAAIHALQDLHCCKFCHKEFKQNGDLLQHIKLAHSIPNSLVCIRCKEQFADKNSLSMHLLEHIKVSMGCMKCGVNCSNSSHIKEYLYVCPACGEIIKHEGSMQRHVQEKHLRLHIKSEQLDILENEALPRPASPSNSASIVTINSLHSMECINIVSENDTESMGSRNSGPDILPSRKRLRSYWKTEFELGVPRILEEEEEYLPETSCKKEREPVTNHLLMKPVVELERMNMKNLKHKTWLPNPVANKRKRLDAANEETDDSAHQFPFVKLEKFDNYTPPEDVNNKYLSVKKKSMVCIPCDTEFNSLYDYEDHMNLCHKVENHNEKRLKKRIPKIKITLDEEPMDFDCDQCDRRFPHLKNLSTHKRFGHEAGQKVDGKKFVCKRCGKVFYLEKFFNKHLLSHSTEKKQLSSNANVIGGKNKFPKKIFCSICNKHFVGILLFAKHACVMSDEQRRKHNEQQILKKAFALDDNPNPQVHADVRPAKRKRMKRKNTIQVSEEENDTDPCEIDESIVGDSSFKTPEVLAREQFLTFGKIVKEFYPTSTAPKAFKKCEFDASKQLQEKKGKRVLEVSFRPVEEEGNSKVVWDVELDYLKELKNQPVYFMDIIEEFKIFLKQYLPKDVKNTDMRAWIILSLRASSDSPNFKIMAVVNSNVELKETLKHFFTPNADKCNLNSLHFRHKHSKATLISGEKDYETYSGKNYKIKFPISPDTKFAYCESGFEMLVETIDNYLKPSSDTTLLEIGCGNGLLGLSFASAFKNIIGFDSLSETEQASSISLYNGVENATFEMDETVLFLDKVKNCNKVTAIVNQSANCGTPFGMMECLQKLARLDHLVIVTPFTTFCFPSLLKLLEPWNKVSDSPFTLERASIVNMSAKENKATIVMLMKRVKTIGNEQMEMLEKISKILSDSGNSEDFDGKKENAVPTNAKTPSKNPKKTKLLGKSNEVAKRLKTLQKRVDQFTSHVDNPLFITSVRDIEEIKTKTFALQVTLENAINHSL